jgi:NAD(P)-dependent dehydrogenase (short-subunit alcohol dehydrogenase family)
VGLSFYRSIASPYKSADVAAKHALLGFSKLEPMPKKVFIAFEEIATAIEYLISPLARNVTAQAIAIDGGWTAQ